MSVNRSTFRNLRPCEERDLLRGVCLIDGITQHGETTMRKAFMIGAAASTLLLAAGAASAQTDQLKPPAPQSNKSDAMPAKSGKQPKQRSKSETTGQASGDVKQQLGTDTKAQKNERKSSATSKSRSETTGQAN